jgi:hypothetical protein
MTTLTAAPPRTTTRTLATGAAMLAVSCVVLAIFDFFIPTTAEYHGPADYVYAANGVPFVTGLALMVLGLRRVLKGRDGKVGTAGMVITMVGLGALMLSIVATLATGSESSIGPAYPLGTLTSFIGLILFTVGALRAKALPWWMTPALTLTWIVGGPVGDAGPLGFKASGLLLTAVAIAIAALAPRVAR